MTLDGGVTETAAELVRRAARRPARSRVVLPSLDWRPTDAFGSRRGEAVRLVVVHRWGVRYTTPAREAASYLGVLVYFGNAAHAASAHVVYPGSAVHGGQRATQMVAWSNKAWAESAYNSVADEIESADAIWLGHDPHGFDVLARMVAKRLQARRLPPTWVRGELLHHGAGGFCRHADLGSAGGGHTQCPTTDLDLWQQFAERVAFQHRRGHFRRRWGR